LLKLATGIGKDAGRGSYPTMAAIVLGIASAAFLGGGLVLTQFGLRYIHPLSGAAISVPSFTIVFLLLSPFMLHGQSIEWRAVPIFVAVGLVFPAALTMLTFASNRALGPVVTGALGNLSPLLSVAVAVLLLHEPLRALQFAGLMVAMLGVFAITVTRTETMRDWRTWALLLPLGASVLRGVIPPVIKIGLESWPVPIAAGLTGYICSTVTVLTIERIRTGRFLVQAPLPGKVWFALNGICNGIGTLLLYAALGSGPVSLVAPLYATYPLFTVGMSVIFLGNVKITWRLVAGTLLTVGGVVLILAG
jgi:drug/metabolite transporter (DMT)-like permease